MQTQTDSQYYLDLLAQQERLKSNRFAGVRTVLVVLSSAGMAYDADGFRSRVQGAYPESAVFFVSTRGDALGAVSQGQVDLLIDLTGPGQKQGLLFARRMRGKARFAVGRDVGFFRKRTYDRIVEDSSVRQSHPGLGPLALEHEVQRRVLALAGVAATPHSESGRDRGKLIALELPPLARA